MCRMGLLSRARHFAWRGRNVESQHVMATTSHIGDVEERGNLHRDLQGVIGAPVARLEQKAEAQKGRLVVEGKSGTRWDHVRGWVRIRRFGSPWGSKGRTWGGLKLRLQRVVANPVEWMV
jgi:hypothetical protein